MSDSPMNGFNQGIIDDFRANNGKVGGPFEGASVLLLTTTGAKTGLARLTPLVYRTEGGRRVIFGSYGGADKHPAWYLNLVANPEVTIEVGDGTTTETIEATATAIEGPERDEIYARQATDMPGFAEYEAKTSRVIPVIALDPKS